MGQSARAGFDAQGTLRERTREHLAAADEAALGPESATGLRWALLKFGASSFSVEIADSRQSISRPEAYEWMNRREKELIAKYGGPLQTYDLDRRVRQTLNLAEGGQGGSERFASAVSLSARHWRTAKENIETYLQTPTALGGGGGTLEKVKQTTTFPLRDGTDFKIGKLLQNVRHLKTFVKFDLGILTWLEHHGFDSSPQGKGSGRRGGRRKGAGRPKGSKNKGVTKHSEHF